MLTCIQGFLWSMMMPMVPLFSRSLGASQVDLGLITIIPSITMIIGTIPCSALGTRYGRRALFLATHLANICCAVGFASLSRLGFIYLPQVFFGLANTLFWPAQAAHITDIVPAHQRTRVIGYILALSGTGMMASPVIGGVLADTLGFRSVFLLYGAIGVLGLLVASTLPKSVARHSVSVLSALIGGLSGSGALLTRPAIKVTLLTMFLLSINQSMTDSFLPVFLKELGYTATAVGTIVTVRTSGITLIRLVVGKIASRIGAMPLLFLGVSTCALTLGLISLYPTPVLIVMAAFVLGVGFGMAPVLATSIIAEYTDSKERALGMALESVSNSTGRVMSGAVTGAVAQITGIGPALTGGNAVVLSGLGAVGMLYLSLFGRRRGANREEAA